MGVTAAREELTRARDDLAAFARLVGWPLQAWQAAALALETRETAIIAPRQMGKSQTLATAAAWWAFRRPGQRVLIVSAGEEPSRRLLSTVRAITASPVLAGSVVDESTSLVTLTNGSEIRSVPASERQVRGWAVDLLLIDEAALVGDDLIEGAAIPTTTARPDARIVLASSPWGPSGAFHRRAIAGLDPTNPHTRSHRWRIEDAPWITQDVVEHARQTLAPARFRAEYLGEFVGASDLYFDRDTVMAAVAPYRLTPAHEAEGEDVAVGLDWGRAADSHAIAVMGLLDDQEQNEEPPYFLPWVETSRRPYAEQVRTIATLQSKTLQAWEARRARPGLNDGSGLPNPHSYRVNGWRVTRVLSETNGVGQMPTEELADRMKGTDVRGIHTSQTTKEDAYGRVRALLETGRLVIPDDEVLLRQLLTVTYAPTAWGGLTIGASGPGADDLADALSLAAVAVQVSTTSGACSTTRDPGDLMRTTSGIAIPRNPRPRRGALRRRRPVLHVS